MDLQEAEISEMKSKQCSYSSKQCHCSLFFRGDLGVLRSPIDFAHFCAKFAHHKIEWGTNQPFAYTTLHREVSFL